MARSLRFWLSLGLSGLVALAVLTLAAALLGVLLPRLNAEVESKNRALGAAAAAQVQSLLEQSGDDLERLAADIAAQWGEHPERLRLMVDTLANTDSHVEAIYAVDSSERVIEVGLPAERRHLRAELVHADFVARPFVRLAREDGRHVWSDTYLSQRGRIVVAVAVPLDLKGSGTTGRPGALVAELSLRQLSTVTQQMGGIGRVLTIIVDRRGQIVAHPDAARSLRQENIGHLPLLRDSLTSRSPTGLFELDGVDYIGSVTTIPGLGWTTLTAQPVDQAYAVVRSTLAALAAASMLALVFALMAAYLTSRRVSRRVADFGRHMQAIAAGDYGSFIPHSSTDEIESLAQSMRRMARAVLEREDRLRLAATVFESSVEGIMITDGRKRIISVNPALLAITGFAREELIGKRPLIFGSGRHDRGFYRRVWASIKADGYWRGEVLSHRKNGEVFPEAVTMTAIRDAAGTVTHYLGSFFDITERRQAQERIEFLAHHDALTQLPNRTLLEDRLRQAIAKSRRNSDFTAVLFLDLDRFKLINDTLGHDAGDRLLQSVAGSLRAALRETETVSRLGGDEFVIVLPELPEVDHVAMLARKILDIVAQPHEVDGKALHVTPSIGISIYPTDGTDGGTLLRNADTAMYHAKESGRNNFQFFSSAMNLAVQERVGIENDLRLALQRGEFMLHYQPQVDCRTGRVTGMEALIRWQHPRHGLLAPIRFIGVAEETGLIVAIGQWVLQEACRQARRWHDAGHTDWRVSVNLSARQFQQPDLHEQIRSAMDEAGIDAAVLEVELTESMLMVNPQAARDVLQNLADLGVKLAIDDFGTGYSSLAYLKRFPVTRLKIDRSFVHDLSSDSNDAAIVNAIVAMAASLKLGVIAEGVETIEQLRYLAAQGCFHIQGYYYSRPKPAGEFESFEFAPLTL